MHSIDAKNVLPGQLSLLSYARGETSRLYTGQCGDALSRGTSVHLMPYSALLYYNLGVSWTTLADRYGFVPSEYSRKHINSGWVQTAH